MYLINVNVYMYLNMSECGLRCTSKSLSLCVAGSAPRE